MNRLKKIALGTVGFLGSVYLTSEMYDFVDLKSSALNPIGREILARENQLWIFVMAMGLLHVIFLFSGSFLSTHKRLRPLGIGIVLAFVVSSSFCSFVAYSRLDEGDRVIHFDKNIWLASEQKPITMARDIYLNWGHCQSREELIETLGRPSMDQGVLWEYSTMEVDSMEVIYYLTDYQYHYLIFNFATVGDSTYIDGLKSKIQDCNSVSLDMIGENANGTEHKYID